MDKKGWMKGVGDGNFYPDEKINYIETLTVMIRAAGKEEEAEDFGGYPLGYEYTADRYGITENISGGLDSPIYRGAIAQLLLNSIEKIDEGESGSGTLEPEDKLGVVKDREFLESSYIKVKKDTDLASAIELLPREVYVTLTSKKAVLLKVNWDYGSGYNKDVSGTYNIKGTVEIPSGISDPNKKLQNLYGNIEVVDGETDTTGEKIVNSYAELGTKDFQAEFGDSETEALKKLTSKTKIYLIGGGSIDADIKWSISGYNGLESEKYDALGKIELPKGVVDRLGVIKDLNATLTVGEEPPNLKINSINLISDTEYKITLNKLLDNLLPNTVTVVEGSGAKSISVNGIDPVDKISYGNSKKELVVKLDTPLTPSGSYIFKVSDGEGPVLEFPHSQIIKPDTNKIDKIIVGDNIVPADEDTQIKFKALNADGIDITETVRESIKVVNTGGDKFADRSFNLEHNQVEFFYLEYKDKDYDIDKDNKQKTPTYRIVGENRRIVSIADWTFGESTPSDWEDTEKVHTMQIGKGNKNIYINPKDQFGDTGKVKLLKDEEVKVEVSPTSLGSIGQGTIKPENENAGANCNYTSNSIAVLTPLVMGTGKLKIEVKRAEGNFNASLDFKVAENYKSNSISTEKNSTTLSSSTSLKHSEDRSDTVKVKVIDQYGNPIEATKNIEATIEFAGEADPIEVTRKDSKYDEFTVTAKSGDPAATGKVKFTYVLDGKTMNTEMTVVVKSPGPVSYMGCIGFKKELVKNTDPDKSEKMEIKIYQYDKAGTAVKRVEDNITAKIVNKAGINANDKVISAETIKDSRGIITISSSGMTPNTVNILKVEVGGIMVLEEKFVVRQ